MDEGSSSSGLSFPVLQGSDLQRVAQTILQLFTPATSSNPALAKSLEKDLQQLQAAPEAWGLIAGLATHEDANVRFFSAHTAQVKISRDWDTLPPELHPALLRLLRELLSNAVNPSNSLSYQPANSVVVRKLFGSLASLLVRLPFYQFPNPLVTVLETIATSAAQATSLPPSAPGSGYNTPAGPSQHTLSQDASRVQHKARLWGLEWCGICVEEIGRAGVSDLKRQALRRHIEGDLPAVMTTISQAMNVRQDYFNAGRQGEKLKEAEAACRCAESWIAYGLGGDELTTLLPPLYDLLPLPAASSAVVEILSESLWRFGKGTKLLTEPLIAWFNNSGNQMLGNCEGESSDETIGIVKLIAALVEHSSEWLVARLAQNDVQAFLGIILRVTGWQGLGGVDENASELTLAVYPLIQEALMDHLSFQAPHDTSPDWAIAKSFFRELINVIRVKVRWPGSGESQDGFGVTDKDDRESFETWRRDAGEVIACTYYILRDDMLQMLTQLALEQVQSGASWQDIEATLHCIRYSSEAVPLGEEKSLPVLFGDAILGQLAQRSLAGRGEERLRLTVVCMIQSYEEWFKFHPDHLLPVLSYLVPSLSSTPSISHSAADALKAICDICRNKLVQHIGAFSELHGKIGSLGPEEQTKVVEAITSVIQALSPEDAIGPVEGIIAPIVERIQHAVNALPSGGEVAQAALIQSLNALAACFKGLSPSDDDMFDLYGDDDDKAKEEAIAMARTDPRLTSLRRNIEEAFASIIHVWQGDAEVADAISSLVKHSTLASSETLISLSPLPLLSLVTVAAERSPSGLWMSLASTLVLRINSPPSPLTVKKDKSPLEEEAFAAEEQQRWSIVADSAQRLVVVAGQLLGATGGMTEHPDVVESWFKYCSAVASRFPGVLLRLPTQIVEAYMSLGVLGLAAQERFSLKTTADFFVALLANTRFPSPLEPVVATLLIHFGTQILRAIILSAGSDGPRSVIPNLAELLASFVTRVPGQQMAEWFNTILAEDGFPDRRATIDAKTRLKTVVLKSRTAKKMREALNEFALVARGLDNTTYGNATAI